LGEIAKGGSAPGGDTIGGEGLHDAADGTVHVLLAGRIGSEVREAGGGFFLGGRMEAFERGMRAAEAVTRRNGGEAAEASVGILELAEVVRVLGSFDSHGEIISQSKSTYK
jgi:hypothetical protein